jgi:Zn-dependent protease
MTGSARQAIVDPWPTDPAGSKEMCVVSMTRSPDSTRSGAGSGPGRPRGGFRLAGFAVRLTLGAQLLAMLTVLAGALVLPDVAPGLPVVAYLAATGVLVIGILASLIAHELAHAVVARRHGATAGEIRIGFFGGTAHGRHEYATPRGLWRAAAAGPASSLILAAASAGIALGLTALHAGPLPAVVFAAFAWINTVLAVLNLLPGAGLDGGRLIQALVWARSGNRARAAITAARVGQIAGAVLLTGGVTALALGYLDGIWAALIGLAMIGTARAQAREVQVITTLAGLYVRDVLARSGSAEAIPGWHTVQSFLDDEAGSPASDGGSGARLGVIGASAFPLRDFEGRAAGLLTLSQLALVPAGQRDRLRLTDVATPIADVVTTTPDEPLGQLLTRLSIRPAIPAALHTAGHALVLTEDGAPAGVLTPDDFRRASQAGRLAQGWQGP